MFARTRTRLWHRSSWYYFGPDRGVLVCFQHIRLACERSNASISAFRLLCGRRTKKLEQKSLAWGLLAHITRDGGFVMVLMGQLSVLPSSCKSPTFVRRHFEGL